MLWVASPANGVFNWWTADQQAIVLDVVSYAVQRFIWRVLEPYEKHSATTALTTWTPLDLCSSRLPQIVKYIPAYLEFHLILWALLHGSFHSISPVLILLAWWSINSFTLHLLLLISNLSSSPSFIRLAWWSINTLMFYFFIFSCFFFLDLTNCYSNYMVID